MNIPPDYEEVIASNVTIGLEEIIESRAYWKKVQSDELKRGKELMPHLLKEQMPI